MKAKVTSVSRVIAAKLDRGEKLLESIGELAREYNVKTGLVNAIGALQPAEVQYFQLGKKEYKSILIAEPVELVSAMGSISRLGDEPVVHLHIAVGLADGRMVGGHCGPASAVSIVGEVLVFETGEPVYRARDPEFNMNFWEPTI